MNHATAPWPAPAKLNLLLRIVGRRADGYHRLQTVFQFLDHGDQLRFQRRDDGQITRSGDLITGVTLEQDLIVRAAKLLQQHCGCPLGADIHLTKHLPMGGGLGGGSSDAATTLVALNHYWQCGLRLEQLAALGIRLGADVPVFVQGLAAWAEGVGEQLTPMPELAQPWYVVLVPNCHVPTAAVFQHPLLTRNSKPSTMRAFLAGEYVGNDCQAVVYQQYPEVAAAAAWLEQFAPAHLTGTGACVFAKFADNTQAQNVLDQLPSGSTGFLARGLNRSPLLERLKSGA